MSWTEHQTNASIRNKVNVPEKEGLLKQIKKRTLKKYGHWKRRPSSTIQVAIKVKQKEEIKLVEESIAGFTIFVPGLMA